jgi:hypothetical protein
MKVKTYLRFLIAVSAAIIVSAAHPAGVWAACPNTGGTLRLLVPNDFGRFVYVCSFDGRRTEHRFGEQATDELRAQLYPLFSSIVVEHVESEAAAKRMIASRDFDRPDMCSYDLIATPQFRNVNFWQRGWHYGFDVDMGVDFYRYDSWKVTIVKGRGEARTGYLADSSPGKSGGLALSKAVEAVADGVCEEGNNLF